MRYTRNQWLRLGISTLLCTFVSALTTKKGSILPFQPRDETGVGDDGFLPETYQVCDYSADFDDLDTLNAAVMSGT